MAGFQVISNGRIWVITEVLDELAPGYRVFVRGPHNDALVWVLSVSKGGSPWWSDRERKVKRSPAEVVVGSSQPVPG